MLDDQFLDKLITKSNEISEKHPLLWLKGMILFHLKDPIIQGSFDVTSQSSLIFYVLLGSAISFQKVVKLGRKTGKSIEEYSHEPRKVKQYGPDEEYEEVVETIDRTWQEHTVRRVKRKRIRKNK